MKFKIDENLPGEAAAILRIAGFQADTVEQENLKGSEDSALIAVAIQEQRILVTLDLDFANIRSYPVGEHAGIIILRPRSQDKPTTLALVGKLALALRDRSAKGELWIVEPDRIRFRSE